MTTQSHRFAPTLGAFLILAASHCSSASQPAGPPGGGGPGTDGGTGGPSGDAPADPGPAVVDGGGPSGTCAAGSTPAPGSDCASCNGTEVDRAVDEQNCGACGTTCGATGFCARGACQTVTLASVCVFPRATLVNDSLADDVTAGTTLAATLAACAPPSTVRTESESMAMTDGVFDSVGRPTIGRGTLLVMPGGPYGQHAVNYLESGTTPVFFRYDSTTYSFARRDTGAAVISTTQASVTAHHDWFVAEIVREPTSGTVSLVTYGFGGGGTLAAAWWLQHVVLPTATLSGAQWHVVEWVDTDNSSTPGTADTFTVVQSG